VALSPLAKEAVEVFRNLATLQTQYMAVERFQLARIIKVILELLQSNIDDRFKRILVVVVRLLCKAFDDDNMLTEAQRAGLVRDALVLLAAIAKAADCPSVLAKIVLALIQAIKDLFALREKNLSIEMKLYNKLVGILLKLQRLLLAVLQANLANLNNRHVGLGSGLLGGYGGLGAGLGGGYDSGFNSVDLLGEGFGSDSLAYGLGGGGGYGDGLGGASGSGSDYGSSYGSDIYTANVGNGLGVGGDYGLGSSGDYGSSAAGNIQRQFLAVRIINLVLQLLRKVIRSAGVTGSGNGYSDSTTYGADSTGLGSGSGYEY